MHFIVYCIRFFFSGLNAEKDLKNKVNFADSLRIGGSMQGAQEDTPRKVDSFMQVSFFPSLV